MAERIDRSTLPGKEELQAMRASGMSFDKIAKQLCVSQGTVKHLFAENGLYVKGERVKKPGSLPDAEVILEEMETMSIAEIAEKYNATKEAVRQKIKDLQNKEKVFMYYEWEKVSAWYARYRRLKNMEALRIARKPRKRVITALEVPHGYIY